MADRSQLESAVNSEAWDLAVLGRYCGPLVRNESGLSIRYRGRHLTFLLGGAQEYHVPLREVFADQAYSWLDVPGREVLDIGAFIGDSAIYFAVRGARRVLAVEPFPASFRLLQANIAANGLDNLVTTVCAGAGCDGSVEVPPGTSGISTELTFSPSGVAVPTYSLGTLLARCDWELDAVAKIDCEGGEYPLLMCASAGDLRRFRRYLVEYHYGIQGLARKLADAGFDVWHTDERPLAKPDGRSQRLGLLRAQRRD